MRPLTLVGAVFASLLVALILIAGALVLRARRERRLDKKAADAFERLRVAKFQQFTVDVDRDNVVEFKRRGQ